MTLTRTFSIIALAGIVALPLQGQAATQEPQDAHHPESTDATQNNPTAPARPADAGRSAMPGYASQMQAMQQMHDKMLAAKTPEDRHALMAEHMKLMRSGMAMMGEMGSGMMQGPSGHMAGRNGTLEQRMDMMQAMMQMMMDGMAAMPSAK